MIANKMQASVEGRWLGGWSNSDPKGFRRMLEQLVEYIDQRLLHPLPARTFPLSQVNEAIAAAHRDSTQLGKVILTLRPQSKEGDNEKAKN